MSSPAGGCGTSEKEKEMSWIVENYLWIVGAGIVWFGLVIMASGD